MGQMEPQSWSQRTPMGEGGRGGSNQFELSFSNVVARACEVPDVLKYPFSMVGPPGTGSDFSRVNLSQITCL